MTNPDETRIRTLVGEHAAAMRARDAKQMLAAYAPEIVQFNLAPPLRHVGPEVHDVTGLEAWLSGFDGPVELQVRDLTVTVGSDVAFCHSLNCLTATPRDASESFSLWHRSTLGLRRIDGDWVITHEHQSTPFYMDGTFAAALDLQP